jgi:predicted nucleotidyltransferase component of viral defense system
MASSVNNNLDDLQRAFLAAFFQREERFYLTGGAALVGFYLGHRQTPDLDLFTLDDVIVEGVTAVKETARQLGATVEAIQTAPDFRRLLLRLGTAAIVIDLVREYVIQRVPEKPSINGIRVDPPEEILANKLCALLAHSEIRDLVDVCALELAGYKVEDALPFAAQKDRGLIAAQLARVLSEVELADELIPPGGISLAELRRYLNDLITRLKRLALPA